MEETIKENEVVKVKDISDEEIDKLIDQFPLKLDLSVGKIFWIMHRPFLIKRKRDKELVLKKLRIADVLRKGTDDDIKMVKKMREEIRKMAVRKSKVEDKITIKKVEKKEEPVSEPL